MWFRIPSFGKVLPSAAQPQYVAFFMLFFGILTTGRGYFKRTKPRPSQSAPPPAGDGRFSAPGGVSLDQWLALSVLAFLLSAALAIVAFRRADQRLAPTTVAYDQSGVFSYGADVDPGIYNNGRITTGDPVYFRQTNTLDVAFEYHLMTNAAHSIAGTAALALEVGADNGWKRVVPLAPPTAFSGDKTTIIGIVDLVRPQILAALVEEQTGVQPQSYTLAILPAITVEGTVENERFRDQFAPRLTFRMEKG